MRFILSLDYELFFGASTGTVGKCLLDPTNAIVNLVERYDAKVVLFVDAGFLVRLCEQATQHRELQRDYDSIRSQLSKLAARGHDIQLHVHSHWEDSYFDGSRWVLDTSRYRLHDFRKDEVARIVELYKGELMKVASDPIVAYRAGGWCLQPFDHIAEALKKSGIWADSTVYFGGLSEDLQRGFDFRSAPDDESWCFDKDPMTPSKSANFLEVPISSVMYGPSFYWSLAVSKKLGSSKHRPYGDGSPIRASGNYYMNRLFHGRRSPLSIDGIKANALRKIDKQPHGRIVNVMGHPKSVTRHSLKQLDAFFLRQRNLIPTTFQHFAPPDFIHV